MKKFFLRAIFFFFMFVLFALPAMPDVARVPDFKDVSYGPHELQTFDLWKAKSGKKTPVVIYFHGGRFSGGEKEHGPEKLIQKLTGRGISVISANYRLLQKAIFLPRPQEDAARVVQFVRLNAEQYNIDPDRIAVSGSSAGGSLALWVALHSDMAVPDSSDPVDRQSTRVSCVMAENAQTTLDPRFMFEHLVRSEKIFAKTAALYGVSPKEMMNPSSKLQKRIDEVSPLTHVSKDNPPVFLVYETKMTELPVPPGSSGEIGHHPAFGLFLQEKMRPLNLEISVYWKNGGTKNNPMPRDDDIDFLAKNLKKTPITENN